MKRWLLAILIAANLFVVVGTNYLAIRDEGKVTAPEDEVLGGRSGFWTSRRPSEGGPYRWRLLGLGFVIASVTGYVLVRVVRSAARSRDASRS
jgi:hypothetical protein